ncbi:MAG: TonB-dependent receptor [Flavobacteriales bacterium]|nr:TonB-dependent receptor [Flavobacteriales bacterium]
MLRLLLLLLGSVWLYEACAQSCLLVVRMDGTPSAGLIVRDRWGATVGTVDAFGRFCTEDPPDTLVFHAKDLMTLRMAWTEAKLAGKVELQAVPRATELEAVAVRPWPSPRERQALAAVSTVDSMDLRMYDRASLRSPLLWVPGVQMDERGQGGSTRFSIRGSLLRSPYGVRGVKVYWGPFSMTLADGSTPLELLDPALVGTLDVVRSIGGPVFGSAPSGLLLATPPERQDTGSDVSISGTGGPDGYFKLSGELRTRVANGNTLSLGLLRMGNDGYRDQEYARRDQVWITQRYALPKGNVRIFLTGQKAAWGLPGSLDSLTAAEQPRSASPYSQQIDARVEKTQLFAGIAVEQRVWQELLLRSSLQVQAIDKVNPYGTSPFYGGYKDERIRSAGSRLSLGRTLRRNNVSFSWEMGLEALLERDQLQERAFVNAVPADLRTDADTRVNTLNGFLSTRTLLGARTTIFVDLGTEATAFRHVDELRNEETSDAPTGELYPLLGVERTFSDQLTGHLRYAQSTSRPTIWEILGSTGIPNTALTAEHVKEAEAGVAFRNNGTAVAVNAYMRRTQDLILPQRVDQGTEEIFVNAGDAEQDGVELEARTGWDLSGKGHLELLLNGAWQHHRLTLPDRTNTVDVPGVPRWTGGARARWSTRPGLRIEAGYRASSSVVANSTNGDRVPGHGVMQLHVGRSWGWSFYRLQVGITAENILNAQYTSFIQLNDPARRYYNPAPGRGLFMDLRFTFDPG